MKYRVISHKHADHDHLLEIEWSPSWWGRVFHDMPTGTRTYIGNGSQWNEVISGGKTINCNLHMSAIMIGVVNNLQAEEKLRTIKWE